MRRTSSPMRSLATALLGDMDTCKGRPPPPSGPRLSNYVVTDGKCNEPIGIYRHKLDTVKPVGKAIFEGDAIDASKYMTHCTIQIRSPLQYSSPVIANCRFTPEHTALLS